ncbi:hypothetical protein [Micromonospora sp. Llam0]|uniref:hypothetical protein n=1 Tax=Micromonospora sp. Llam0 TaxID=2485143 RepID=UPI0011CDE324|nr:hypothetical protein [Micromonospora sp. Llam0]
MGMDGLGMQNLTGDMRRSIAERFARSGWVEMATGEEDYAVLGKCKGDLGLRIGFDLSMREFGLSLNPSVGVHHGRVSALVGSLYGLSDGGFLVGSSLAGLFDAAGREGGLLPRWCVLSNDDVDLVVDLLESDIRAYAIPYFDGFSNFSDIASSLKERPNISQFELGRLAVVCAELGDLSSARSAISSIRRLADFSSTFVADQIRLFIGNFEKEYGC